jgi:hypothetical protein
MMLKILVNRILFWGIGKNDFIKVLMQDHPERTRASADLFFQRHIAIKDAPQRRKLMRAFKILRRAESFQCDFL